MKPVIGIDVSSDKSTAIAYSDYDNVFCDIFEFNHTVIGFESLAKVLVELQELTKTKPEVILEATGLYSVPVTKFIQDRGYRVITINPLISKQVRMNKLRKTKTDRIDCVNLALVYYNKQFNISYDKTKLERQIQSISRDLELKIAMQTQLKNNLKQQIIRVFPNYISLFSDMYSETSFTILHKYTHPKIVINSSREVVIRDMAALMGKSRSAKFIENKADQLIEIAKDCFSSVEIEDIEVSLLQEDIQLIREYQKLVEHRKHMLISLTQQNELFTILVSIPGIGEKSSASFIAEVSNLDRFDHVNQLIAYAGIEPSVYQSGKYNSRSCSITKRGNSHLRHLLFVMVSCGIKNNNEVLKAYYNKKRRLEGKPYKVAMVACMNKLLRIIFSLHIKKELFVQT